MNSTLLQFRKAAERASTHLAEALAQIRTDRATPALVENIPVDAYGATQPVKALATIGTSDARTLVLQAWDPTLGVAIGAAIAASPLGVNPTVEGGTVRFSLPQLTTERRTSLLKTLSEKREAARIAVRSARDEGMRSIRASEREGSVSEDVAAAALKELERAVTEANTAIETLANARRAELEPA